MKQESDADLETARAVLRYLQDHPDAKDTLQGIAQWWILRECAERKMSEVEEVVSVLLANGLIVEMRREGRPSYYGFNKETTTAE
ncbi:MAG TPA: hypothetical protein VNG71_04670 [Pyrinomonadaceae bacterium]|nr:hypothetical protein [Pyrinomonadaceae bacterium]